jgi:hypothetical protein
MIMGGSACVVDLTNDMVEVRKHCPAIRKIAADQTLAKPPRQLSPEEAKQLADKGYTACLDEDLPSEYAELYRRETEEILQKSF